MADYDLLVIGAGPGGYVAAIRGAQLGLKTACVEKEAALGGTCLRVGCIPSKALLEASQLFHEAQHSFAKLGIDVAGVTLNLQQMLARKDNVVSELTNGVAFLFKKNKITRLEGTGSFVAREGEETRVAVTKADGSVSEVTAKHVIIATGSKVATLPSLEWDGDRIGGSTEALAYPSVPKHLVVIGAGVIGLELGSVWARLGAQVTVLEYLDRILPGMDTEIAKLAQRSFEKQGLTFKLGTKVTGARVEGERCVVEVEGQEPLRCDRVLVAVGRKPNTDGLALDRVGLSVDARGRVPVDQHFRTSVSGIYAIGDVIIGPMLAHKAEDEGVACVEHLVTGYGHVNYDAIPGIVYTSPEVASVGKTEEELQASGVAYRKGSFPFSANGRAKAIGHTEGKVKILADAQTDRVLGVHIFGPHAGDLIAECAVAIEFGATSEDIARCCHAHPTLAEAVKEAAFAVDNRTIHL